MANSSSSFPQISSLPSPWNEPVQSYLTSSTMGKNLQKELTSQLSKVLEIPLVIHGQHLTTEQPQNIHLPHDHSKIFARAHTATSAHVEQAINACLEARKSWALLPQKERSAVFLRAAEKLAGTHRAEVVAATMLAQNKTAQQAEYDAACETIDFLRYQAYFADQLSHLKPETSAPGEWNQLEARPLEGFIYAVAPFNFTAISVNLAAAPALMGCSVLWKPAPEALPASYMCLKILEQCGLPPGVINMVHGDPELISEVALNHPQLSGLHFTGSTQTFQHLWKSLGERITTYHHYPRIVGETGGKGFIFAHPSASEKAVISALIRGAFEYQGQKCSAASRAYIPESLWQKIKEPLIELTKSLKVGRPEDPETFVAAVINKKAWHKITHYLGIAHKEPHYTVLQGGKSDSTQGYFVEPTLIQSKTADSKLMSEEIFGPLLTLFVYPDQDVLKTAQICEKTSPYALTGSIMATDRLALHQLMEILRYSAGNLYINTKPTGAVVGQQPFGGSRASGTNDKAGSPLMLQRWLTYRTIKEVFDPQDPALFNLSS